MSAHYRYLRVAFLLLTSWIPATTTAATTPVTEVHYVMGTYFSITIDDLAEREARPAMRRCFHEARRLEEVFSRYDPASELTRLNTRRKPGPIEVSTDLADLLAKSLQLGALTAGTFDVTIGALTPPSGTAEVGLRGPSLFAQEKEPVLSGRLLVLPPGVQLDFDGIAKGYAVDRCVNLLRASAVQRALLSLGESSQYGLGAPLGAPAWTVAVRDLGGDRILGTLALRDQALSVSSAFTRERHVAHIVDPRSGEPLREPSVAVVVAHSATDAEAWSKALLISGAEKWPGNAPAALRISRRGIEQRGSIAFTAHASPRAIGADAEPFL